jgi:hypothetical protein
MSMGSAPPAWIVADPSLPAIVRQLRMPLAAAARRNLFRGMP